MVLALALGIAGQQWQMSERPPTVHDALLAGISDQSSFNEWVVRLDQTGDPLQSYWLNVLHPWFADPALFARAPGPNLEPFRDGKPPPPVMVPEGWIS